MNPATYQRLMAQGGWANLSDRAKWRLAGADRVRYLNGQVTNDVRRAAPDSALYACVTNVKGRIEGDVFIHTDADSLLLDAEAGLRDPLGMRLEKYIIADDAVLEDVTDQWQLWHVFGPAADAVLADGGRQSLVHPIRCQRLGVPGADIWLPAEAQPLIPPAEAVSPEEFETLRILQRVPRFPHELNADTFPQEAGLDTRAMSFTKGCYIGQEILSRIKTTGKMPRQLVAWAAVEGDIVSGDALFLPSSGAEPKPIGLITSVARHPVSRKQVGLGFIKQGSSVLDSGLLVRGDVPKLATSVKISPAVNQ